MRSLVAPTHNVFFSPRKGEQMSLYMHGSHHEEWRRRCDGVGGGLAGGTVEAGLH